MVFFVLKGCEYALRYLRYKQLSRKIVKIFSLSIKSKQLNQHITSEKSTLARIANDVAKSMLWIASVI
jgi:hypothetical protein